MKINVGISVLATHGANILNSGLNQNLAFLAMLLRNAPDVGEIYLLNGGNVDELPAGMAEAIPGISLVKLADVTHKVNLVIEMGAQLDGEWLRRVRALGAKIVIFMVGQSYVQAAETPMFELPGGMTFNDSPWHEVWMLPHHVNSSRSLLRTLARVPVHVVPHIWDPVYLDGQIAAVRERGDAFGYMPDAEGEPRRAWRTAIFEPNISVVKSCVVPMLICEQAFRLDPGSVGMMMVMNSFHMKEHPTFNAFASNLDLTRQHKASYEPRLGFADCMGTSRMDAVVSHHWECGLNYAYYDALYGGYPLVHNSDYLRDAGQGFYYPHFSAGKGAESLLRARSYDAGFWQDYRKSAAAYLAKLSPGAPSNIDGFMHRIRDLAGSRA